MSINNKYTWAQKWLHELSLYPRSIRELTFDLENLLISEPSQSRGNHVFISGLARSGTTALLNAIFSSGVFASLTYADMPFVLAPNIWSKISPISPHQRQMERAHEDGIFVSVNSPEAFEEVFWMTFDEDQTETKPKFKKFTDSVMMRYQRTRYLSKNNQNHQRLKLIADVFPNATLLVPFREPAQHALSILNQHEKFVEQSKSDPFTKRYMALIGHTEFGPVYKPAFTNKLAFKDAFDINHWLEQWLHLYQRLHNDLAAFNNVYFVCYESLCSSKLCWAGIQNLIGIRSETTFSASVKTIPEQIDLSILNDCESLYQSMKDSAL